MSLTIRLFGPIDIRVDGAPLPRLRSRKGEWLLALLALKAASPASLPRDWLAGTLWPDSSASHALRNLRTSLADLRGILGEARERIRPIASHRLTIHLGAAEVDLHAFDVAIARGDVAALTHAVSLYRGPLLDGCAEPWAVEERQAREEAFLAALERLAAHAMEQGDTSAAMEHLHRLTAIDPLREAAQRSLMHALAAHGQVAAALALYRDLRILLHRELNLAPDPETTALYERLRRLAVSPSPSVSFVSSVAHSPPPPPTPLIGRERELAVVVALLAQDEVRLVTLTGVGGSGKTRLAVEVARVVRDRFPDGVCFVSLAPLRDASLVPDTIARQLGLREGPERRLPEQLRAALSSRSVLLILDNFEHLSPAAPSVAELLAACLGVKLLVTSRSRLAIRGEQCYPIAPLRRDPAVSLFVQRAREVNPEFQLTIENAATVAAICDRLDRLPLALELAATWLRLLPPRALLDRLDRPLSLLVDGARDLPSRQQSLRETIAWSHDLLSEPERRLFRRLALFAGGFTAEAAEAVSPDEPVLPLLAALVDRSLLGSDAVEPRFEILETIREFAHDCLVASGEESQVRRRHARFYCDFARRRPGERQRVWFPRLEREQDNLRAALTGAIRVGEVEICLQMVRWFSLGMFWVVQGHLTEGRARLAEILALPGAAAESEARGEALRAAGVLASRQGDYPAACFYLRESVALFRRLGLTRPAIDSLHYLGRATCSQGDDATTRTLMEESLAISKANGYQCETADALSILGAVCRRQGDYERAAAIYEESLALYGGRETRSWLVGRELRNLGHVAAARGDLAEASDLFREGLEILRETGQKSEVPGCLAGLGGVVAARGEPQRAARLLGAAHALILDSGATWEPEERTEYERHWDAARRELTEDAFATSWAEGTTMSIDAAISVALASDDVRDEQGIAASTHERHLEP